MTDTAGIVADTVYHHRTRVGLSQRELAERAGVSRHTVVNLENGNNQGMQLKTISQVLDALGLEISFVPRRGVTPHAEEDARVARELPL